LSSVSQSSEAAAAAQHEWRIRKELLPLHAMRWLQYSKLGRTVQSYGVCTSFVDGHVLMMLIALLGFSAFFFLT